MSSNTNLSYKRAVRILTGACGLLFSAFSFIYLYLFQGDVLGHYTIRCLRERLIIRLWREPLSLHLSY